VKRNAFTLVEVMVALVVTGLVVSIAYASVQAGLETSERITVARTGEEREIVARALLARAIRHAVPGAIGGQPVFILRDQPSGDELTFRTRGVSEPFGASGLWEVALLPDQDGVRLTGVAVDNSNASFTTLLPRVRRIDVRVLGRDVRDGWFESWPYAERSPVAVTIAFLDVNGQSIGTQLVSRVGLEGNR
jgi:prepilin-type N-terminal cleavage/methylation domain-containing protein